MTPPLRLYKTNTNFIPKGCWGVWPAPACDVQQQRGAVEGLHCADEVGPVHQRVEGQAVQRLAGDGRQGLHHQRLVAVGAGAGIAVARTSHDLHSKTKTMYSLIHMQPENIN